jgi:PPOX class probable FMN-dependent enzyme
VLDSTQLRDAVGEPSDLVIRKQLDRLEEHTCRFIAAAPMVILATAGADGSCDASPRGDPAGFVRVLGERRLLLPDRKGNRRVDSMRNIAANPNVGLLFIVPGTSETARVNGAATIVDNPELLAPSAVNGVAPKLGILVEVREVFLHCARAFLRAKLWTPDTWPERGELPTLGTALRDQLGLEVDAATIDADLERSNQSLY